MFNEQDLARIRAHGLAPEQVERQIENFKRGFPFLRVLRAAAPDDGILMPAPQELAAAARRYDEAAKRLDIVKFVPASGAATRMFKELFAFIDEGKRTEGIDRLLRNIEHFAFWPELKALLPAEADDRTVVEYIVRKGLRYGASPKGLVTFHAYAEGARKAVEEHLVEGAQYAASDGRVRIHFTVSPEHRAAFEALVAERAPRYEARFGLHYDIGFSEQKPSTDTVAVNPDNTLFRTDDGALLFRPAGHGALIENLNDIDADIIFVKNIDNVTTDALRGDTVTYKKVLAGLLLELQEQCFEYIRALDTGGAELGIIARFIRDRLCVRLPDNYNSALLRAVLDRPIRVCGMVRNEGEPGGGPFWVANADGTESASEQLYQVVGAGTSTIESVPCAIALVELAQTDPNRCAVLCANLGGDTDTIGAMATAICGALHGVNAIDPALKAELDAVNQLDFNRYATALAKYRQQREAV